MSFGRKLKRQQMELHKTNCCGQQMQYKPNYGYVCQICGKTLNKEKKNNE